MLSLIKPMSKNSEQLIKYLETHYSNKKHKYCVLFSILRDMILPINP